MKLKLFSHTIDDAAKAWLVSHPAGTFDTWDKFPATFLSKYYPDMKSCKARSWILNF